MKLVLGAFTVLVYGETPLLALQFSLTLLKTIL